jgi:magnesium-transporting ATPase (P-type)
MMSIIDAYRKRKYVDDIEIIKKLGGTSALLKGLDSDNKKGISKSSMDEREKAFGSHYKEPPTATGFCNMVKTALDDLMLKVLIVCAFFSIFVDMGFAWGDPEKMKTAWIEGFAILTAVAVVSLFSAWSDNNKE